MILCELLFKEIILFNVTLYLQNTMYLRNHRTNFPRIQVTFVQSLYFHIQNRIDKFREITYLYAWLIDYRVFCVIFAEVKNRINEAHLHLLLPHICQVTI